MKKLLIYGSLDAKMKKKSRKRKHRAKMARKRLCRLEHVRISAGLEKKNQFERPGYVLYKKRKRHPFCHPGGYAGS
jgi:hypothetical protein